jgi:hypothetical protein
MMKCPGCGKSFKVPDEFIGKRVQCNKCGEKFVVPEPELTIEYEPIPDGSESTDSPPSDEILSDFEELLDELQEGNKQERREAARQIRDLADPDAVDVLLDCMGDKDVEVRRYIAEAFGEMGGKQALAGLLGMAYDDDVLVRVHAYEGMVHLPEPAGLELSAYFNLTEMMGFQFSEMLAALEKCSRGKLEMTPYLARRLYWRCDSMYRNPNFEDEMLFEAKLEVRKWRSHFAAQCKEFGVEVNFD